MIGDCDFESPTDLAAVHAFYERFARDRDTGRVRPLSDYQEIFPRHAALIASEYAVLVGDPAGHEAAPSTPVEWIGPYRLERELGRGGQGFVWLATDSRLGRKVALKVLAPGLGAAVGALDRFRREAEVASRLDHPGICPVYEVGQAQGMPFIAMKYVEGASLAQIVARDRDSGRDAGTRDRLLDRVQLIEEAARAIDAAHAVGIVHRDLKPGNLMVASDGRPVILDFGLARSLEEEQLRLTRSGDVFGTPPYMAPEQFRADGATADRRTDVYALGATLYEALTLRPPFEAPTREALYRQIVASDPPYPVAIFGRLPRDLRTVLETALDKNPDRRYGTAGDLAEDLRRVRMREPIRARPAGPARRLLRWAQRNPAIAASVALAFVSLLTGLVITQRLLRQVSAGYETARALALTGGSVQEMDQDQMLSLLLANEAVRVEETPETISQLRNSLAHVRERRILSGCRGFATMAAWSPDGTRVVTACGYGLATVWGQSESEPLRLTGPPSEVDWAEWSPDGTRLATTYYSGYTALWSDQGTEVRRFESEQATPAPGGASRRQQRVAFDPRGGRFAMAGRDGDVVVRNLDGAEIRRMSLGPSSRIAAVSYSPSGERLLAVGASGEIRIWRADGEAKAVELAGQERQITAIAWSPLGTHVAAGAGDGTTCVWSVDGTPKSRFEGNPSTRRGFVSAVTFSPDGAYVLVAYESGQSADLWSLDGTLERTYRGHVGWVSDAKFSADGRLVLTASNDATARLFTFEGRPVAVLRGHEDLVTTATFSPSGREILTASWDGTARLWNLEVDGFEVFHGHENAVFCCAFSPSGDRIATGSVDGRVILWNASGVPTQLENRRVMVNSVAFSPDGARLLIGSQQGEIRVLDIASRDLLWTHHLGSAVHAAQFLPDGTHVIAGTGWAGAQIHEVGGFGVPILQLEHDGPEKQVLDVATSPDGRWIALARFVDARLYEAATGRIVVTFGHKPGTGHSAAWGSVAFSPDGRMLVTGSIDGTARIWDLSGNLLAVLAHEAKVNRVAFFPDSTKLVTASKDGTARIWDVEGHELGVLRAGEGIVLSVAVSPDGRRILTAHSDWTARLWPASTTELFDLARRRIVRDFSPTERARYADLLAPR